MVSVISEIEMENKLVIIEREEWENLRELYLPEKPGTILGLSTISNYIRWSKMCPQIDDLTIYCLNGNWSDGLFVVVVCPVSNIIYLNKEKKFVSINFEYLFFFQIYRTDIIFILTA